MKVGVYRIKHQNLVILKEESYSTMLSSLRLWRRTNMGQQPCTWLDGTFATWIQNLILLITAIVAFIAYKNQQKLSVQKATVDILIQENMDKSYQDQYIEFSKLRNNVNGETSAKYATKDLTKYIQENEALLSVFNQYEFIAIGINECIFDENLYKQTKKGLLIKDYNYLKPWIMHVRELSGNNKIGINFEDLAERWKKGN